MNALNACAQLPVVQRLTSRQQFQAVMAGVIAAKTHHFALHRTPLGGGVHGSRAGVPSSQAAPTGQSSGLVQALFPVNDTWLGVLLPKRWARRAVTRNAIRRQIYAIVHENPGLLPTDAWVVRLRCEFSRQQFVSASSDLLKRAVRAELTLLLRRATAAPTPRQQPPASAQDMPHGV